MAFSNRDNVGWLDSCWPFPTAETSAEFRRKLFRLCQSPVNRTRGFHRCPFCGQEPVRMTLESETIDYGGVSAHPSMRVGSAEIRVGCYAAPDMIIHYVMDHEYCPPQCFIDAVMAHDDG